MSPFKTEGNTVYVTRSTNLALYADDKRVVIRANVQMTGPIYGATSILCESGAIYRSHENA